MYLYIYIYMYKRSLRYNICMYVCIYIYIYLKEVIEEGVITKLGVLGVNKILRGFEEDLCHIHRVLVMRYHLAVLPQYVHLYIPTTTTA